jgi:hypothetical protein
MANSSKLGGSPLGLIGVSSWHDRNGMSTFNAGKTRNIKVVDYNRNESSSGTLYGNSIFSGYRTVRAWPNIKKNDDGSYDVTGARDVNYEDGADGSKKGDYSTRKTLHNNDIYDTSILNIIEKLSPTKAALRPTDFAYLKNVGVYPNNRLMVARRFASPSADNIMVNKKDSELGTLAVLMSWKPEGEDFLQMNFGEEWQDSEADFKNILSELGNDVGLENAGGIAGAAGNALPLPGFTEIFQRAFLSKIGIMNTDAAETIPAGNPNLIKSAKRRKLIGYGEAGSGLKCTVNISMTCEYELKYISGIDPTIVWMDLLSVITRFGTSNSQTYGLSKGSSEKLIGWANNPNKLVADAAKAISESIGEIINKVQEVIDAAYNKATKIANSIKETIGGDEKKKTKKQEALDKADNDKKKNEGFLNKIKDTIGGLALSALKGLMMKYRIKVIGIINALSGLPSTPWHITIGNPLRPVFCSGDMLVENVDLKLGPILSFNDLPSTITVSFNMTNARPWGLQEIMSKFNSGYLRTVDIQKTYYETNLIKSKTNENEYYNEPVGVLPLNDIKYGEVPKTESTTATSDVPTESNNANNNPVSKMENGRTSDDKEMNRDPNLSTYADVDKRL